MSDFKRLKNCIPKCGRILLVEFISGLTLYAFLRALRFVSGSLLNIIDRPAFTSGDLPYLLRSWQGILVVIVGIIVLFVYVALDLNVSIIMSKQILDDKQINLKYIITQAFKNLRLLLCPTGIIIILFISFIIPLTGLGMGISLTSSFRIPDFILTVIHSKPVLYILYWAFVLVALVVEIVYVFTLHFINLEHIEPKQALKEARKLFMNNKKEFFGRMLPFVIMILAYSAVLLIIFVIVPVSAIMSVQIETSICRFLLLLFMGIGTLIIMFCTSLLDIAVFVELTALYEEFRGNTVEIEDKKVSTRRLKQIVCGLLAVNLIATVFLTINFDKCFPEYEDESYTIAHRGAGNLTNENTVEAINIAYEIGADIAEIDIHRTKDGDYILNHDNDFYRLTGDSRTPQEMTVEEIKKLRMNDGSQIATLDEILDAAKDKIGLYIELKGVSADKQMVDDVYKKLKERDMLDQCSMISLNYDVIEYAETTYPEVDTAYLLFFGFGDLGNLKCDSLALEQESATKENVIKAHKAGKRVDVWTCNTLSNLITVINTEANGIITDEPLLLKVIKIVEMLNDSDLLRIVKTIVPDI